MAQKSDEKMQAGANTEEIGTVRIADDVVSTIIAYAVLEVDGVAGLQGNTGEGFLKKAGMKRPNMGVRVDMEDGNVRADISITMDYGYNIPVTCSKIQTRVKQAVESMTGLRAEDVNVRIAGIRMPQEETPAQTEQ